MTDKRSTQPNRPPQRVTQPARQGKIRAQAGERGRAAVSARLFPPATERPALRWLFITLLKAGVFLGVGLFLIVSLGFAQRLGWISASGGASGSPRAGQAHDHGETYTCPMHPQIRQPEPGRCPICGMALVPAAEETGSSLDELAVHIEPAARRVAGIETAAARTMALQRTITSVGEIAVDETRMATITAWVDGRIERLFADYTGVKVEKGDHLVHLYSPQMYAAQVEYLVTRQSAARAGNGQPRLLRGTDKRLLDSSREKLSQLGMTEQQIRELDESGKAQTRLKIHAPVGGTVLKKPKVEGEYVETGDVIYSIADLSTVWLMLELFPDDAAQISYGQRVEARVQSLPGEVFAGRVSFVDPTVDKQTRTVGVRVDIPNPDGRLRPGDYASATIRVPVSNRAEMYDAELAGKWISPRHPQIVRDKPGQCPLCGIELVPASRLGFTGQPVERHRATVVPRSAVLMAGTGSVVYVETEPGRFEIRPVTLGPMIDRKAASETGTTEARSMAVVLDGVEPGEKVATAGNFLIDSQMQLAGKPSVIDPTRARIQRKEKPGPLKLDYDRPRQLAGEAGEALDRLYAAYFAIQQRLAADATPTAAEVSRFASALAELRTSADLPEPASRQLGTLDGVVAPLKRAKLDEFRKRFKPISRAVVRLAAQVRGPETAGTFIHFYCPMVSGGGDWLQPNEKTANPYFGSRMLRCGEAVHRIAARPPRSAATSRPNQGRASGPRTDGSAPVSVPVPEEPVPQ